MWRGLSTWFSGSCEVLFPRECLVCTRPLRGYSLCRRCHPPRFVTTTHRCPRCFASVGYSSDSDPCPTCVTFPPITDRMRYLWEYGDLARDFIRAMKYRPSVYLTRYGARLITDTMEQLFRDRDWDVIVPIPSSPDMLKKRAFHPCHEMARVIRRTLPHCKIVHALHHAKNRTPQAQRTHSERLEGLRGIFAVSDPSKVAGSRVLIVEDVITTGATIAAAAYALRRAGAKEVDVVALAQARVWSRFRRRLFEIFALDSKSKQHARGPAPCHAPMHPSDG